MKYKTIYSDLSKLFPLSKIRKETEDDKSEEYDEYDENIANLVMQDNINDRIALYKEIEKQLKEGQYILACDCFNFPPDDESQKT